MWRCLIIEDDPVNARYLAEGLRELGHVPVVCENGPEGLTRALEDNYDILILDRLLPNDVDGLSILKTLRGLGKMTPVLVLSALTGLDERVRGLKAGGDDYLTKPFAFPELLARMEALIRRSASGPDVNILQVADLRVDLVARKVERGGRHIPLQPREFQLLAYLRKNTDQIVTRTMMLAAVWNYHFDPQTNVIDVQISRLRQKVDGGFTRSLIHTIRGSGYMLSERLNAQERTDGERV